MEEESGEGRAEAEAFENQTQESRGGEDPFPSGGDGLYKGNLTGRSTRWLAFCLLFYFSSR
jgi:hypothetical protein